MIRNREPYPRDEVVSGITICGDNVVDNVVRSKFDKSWAVVTWNNYGIGAETGKDCKDAGGLHVCMENGYFKRKAGYRIMTRSGFNGNEEFYGEGDITRWRQLGIDIRPWNKDGKYILVAAQRGKAYNDMAMSDAWPEEILPAIRERTKRPILYKPHPGRQIVPKKLPKDTEVIGAKDPIEKYFDDAFAVVVWTSNSATDALIAGVPVFYCGPTIACYALSSMGIDNIEDPIYPNNRLGVFSELAYHQWNLQEIESGQAWAYVTH
jgi:hypothetical protein